MTAAYSTTWWAAVLSIGAVGIALTVATGPADADQWTGPDKTQHAIAGAAIGSAVTLGTKSAAYGCAAAAGVGALKEVADSRSTQHTASFKDFAVTALAGCLASGATGLIVTPTAVIYRKEF